MRLLSTLILLGALAGGGYWVWNNVPEARNFLEAHIDRERFTTLEVRYSAEQIMEANRETLLADEDHTFLRPALRFSPYLLMEVKYTDKKNTREGLILWSLENGEMVVDATSWERTHGFQDCLKGKASRNDFRILHALSANGGAMHRDDLANALHVELDLLDNWVESCRLKRLIVQNGGRYRLHFQHPKLNVNPETRFTRDLVTKPYKGANRLSKRYSSAQIEKLTEAAFGQDFTVRNTKEVFLPIYQIVIQNPDGSKQTTCWNALNGKQLNQSYTQWN